MLWMPLLVQNPLLGKAMRVTSTQVYCKTVLYAHWLFSFEKYLI